jgi:N-acetylglucosamine-6-phosphate deacetylase
VRGPALLPVEPPTELEDDLDWDDEDQEPIWGDDLDEGPSAASRDSQSVALRLVPDAAVAVQGDRIVSAGAYQSSLYMDRLMSREAPKWFPGEIAKALERARTWRGLILPGLVDIHCHGGGGQSFPDAATADDALVAVREHLRHGTTSLVASLVTDAPEVLIRQVGLLAELCEAGDLAGIHLEGPFLSARRAGAQDPAKMQAPDAELVRAVAEAARGWFAVMTVAPELAGVVAGVVSGSGSAAPGGGAAAAGEAASGYSGGEAASGKGGGETASGKTGAESVIGALAAAGAVASFGHTDCSAEQMAAAVAEAGRALAAAGARFGRVPTATHLFNGMRPIHHRDPGPAMEAMGQAARGRMTVELVADGVHLDRRLVEAVFATVGWRNVALVTDAMAAAGMPDGTYQLGPAAVTVAGGVARLTGGESIAGGTSHLLDVVRSAWRGGVSLEEAVGSASLVPARVLGLERSVGSLAPGRAANLILADSELNPVEVYKSGRLVR